MELIPLNPIAQRILLIRGHRVMLDSDLAGLYEVETRTLVRLLSEILTASPLILCFSLIIKRLQF